MKKVIKLNESDLTRIVKRVIVESMVSYEEFMHNMSEDGEFKDVLSDDSVEPEYKEKIRKVLKQVRDLEHYESNGEDNLGLIITANNLFNKLKRIKKFLNHPINLNIYKDKYGNKYLQARSSYTSDGKLKQVNGYVGSLNDFPEGVKSLDAMKKGKILIRRKLESVYNIL
jgi:hypothetical protein